jgi:hypothetical protein
LKDYVPENAIKNGVKDVLESEKKGCDNAEVLAVLAHELGHWKLNHVLKNIVIMQVLYKITSRQWFQFGCK